MKTITYIAKFLINKGIDTVFELQGGMITRIIDELCKHSEIKVVSLHHEQAAAFAAEAFGRVTNKPGIAMATSGPGATNLITGIGSCYFDSVPAIFITGQVNLNEQKSGESIRQLGFQETDIVSMVKPITKATYAVKNANDIPKIFNEAYRISMEGRPGPVLIDIPMNIQNAEIENYNRITNEEIDSLSNSSSNIQPLLDSPDVLTISEQMTEIKDVVNHNISLNNSQESFDTATNSIAKNDVKKFKSDTALLEEAAIAPGNNISASLSTNTSLKGKDINDRTNNQKLPNSHSNIEINLSDETVIFIHKFFHALESSKRPLILAGRGIRLSNSTNEFLNFIEKINIPVVTSLLGIDVIPYQHPNRLGFIGTYGNRWANYALGSCDLLLVIGSRLDLRQTGADVQSFKQNKAIFHIDIEQAELNNRVKDCFTLCSDSKYFIKKILTYNFPKKNTDEWIQEIDKIKEKRPDTKELEDITGINPNTFIHSLSKKSLLARAYTTDVGNNQMWAAQSIELNPDQLFLSSGGMGAMGYSLPAAIGASISLGKAPIVSISGDGGFQINIQELQTIRRNNLPIKLIVLNNNCLGMIRQFQDSYFSSQYHETVWGYDAPNFEIVAKAYGIDAATISTPEEIEEGLQKLWKDPCQPFLLNVNINIHTNVYPKMLFGNPITQMDPKIL